MAESSIKSSCLNIERYFSDAVNKKFIIPDYQRPYSWGEDQIRTLFDDLVTFMEESRDKEGQQYFLGSVVTFENVDGELEVIDGQQRITSMCLLLRCLYKRYSGTTEPSTKKLIDRLESCLWKVDLEKDIIYKDWSVIESRAVADEKSDVLREILLKGEADAKAKALIQKTTVFSNLYGTIIVSKMERKLILF